MLLCSSMVGCTAPASHPGNQPLRAVDRTWAFADTITTDENFTIRLFNHDSLWPGAMDSVAIDHPHGTRALRLNKGGYIGGHTCLNWTSDRYVCFGFGCGSPCWGVLILDLSNEVPPIERMFTAYEDSVLNLLCYADTAYDEGHQSFILEDLSSGSLHRFALPMKRVGVPAASVDSAWMSGTRICLRCAGRDRTTCSNVPWLRE